MNRCLLQAAILSGVLMPLVGCSSSSDGKSSSPGSTTPAVGNTGGSSNAGGSSSATGAGGATGGANGGANAASAAMNGTSGTSGTSGSMSGAATGSMSGASGTMTTPGQSGGMSGGSPAGGSGTGTMTGGTSGGSTGGGTTTTPTNGVVPPGWTGDCGLHTQWAGDDRCIAPPPSDLGFQVHVGPSDYTNPDPTYIMQPGDEITSDFPATSSNTDMRYFYYRQYRMRPTAHHMVLTTSDALTATSAGSLGRRIATANRPGDYPVNGMTAPENVGVGSPIGPSAPIITSLHAINAGTTPQLREIWVNFWYKDAKDVTEPATPWFKIGSQAIAIPPGADTYLGPYTCSVNSAGRLLWLYGHRHASNVGFEVNRIRAAQTNLIYAGYHWDEPITLQYDSITTNTVADPSQSIEGGWTGILDLQAGDTIQWTCHIINKQNTTLTFSNQTYLGEMCIVDAEAVGTDCAGL